MDVSTCLFIPVAPTGLRILEVLPCLSICHFIPGSRAGLGTEGELNVGLAENGF